MSSRAPARLSSDLLIRKGMAAPSAEPETRANMVGAPLAAETTRPRPRQGPALARSTLADWVAPEPAPEHAPLAGAQGQKNRRAQHRVRVSLRLDADRHTRLKLVATQRACTLQSLFTEAIDEFFIRHAPDLHGISAQLRKGMETTGRGGEISRGKGNSEGQNGPSRSR